MKPLLHACLLFVAACTGGGAASVDGGNTGGDTGGEPAAADVPAHILALEQDTWGLVNLERTSRAIAALTHDDLLREVARAHSQDMVDRGFFAHENPDGLDPFERMALAGATFSAAAENIAWNQGFADPAATAVDGWMASTGHRDNILDDRYTSTGLGVAEDSAGALYFTQVFVRATGAVRLVGWSSAQQVGLDRPDVVTSGWSADGRAAR